MVAFIPSTFHIWNCIDDLALSWTTSYQSYGVGVGSSWSKALSPPRISSLGWQLFGIRERSILIVVFIFPVGHLRRATSLLPALSEDNFLKSPTFHFSQHHLSHTIKRSSLSHPFWALAQGFRVLFEAPSLLEVPVGVVFWIQNYFLVQTGFGVNGGNTQ